MSFALYISCFLFLALLSEQAPLFERSISPAPAIAANFPDPTIIQVNGVWYAFSTNSNRRNIPVATSPDFINWSVTGADALPILGAWTVSGGGGVWAPSVTQLSDGYFVMYYSARPNNDPNYHCIGAAKSANVQGPYTPFPEPTICDHAGGGAIDGAAFTDFDGQRYMVYKVDGNNIGRGGSCGNTVAPIVPTPIMLQNMAADGVTPVGSPVQLIDRDPIDGPLIEAPSLMRIGNTYVLFFSSNCYTTSLYDVSYATSVGSVSGPWTKQQGPYAPLLVTGSDNGNLWAPGGLTVAQDGYHVVFHADAVHDWTADRPMWAGTISVNGRVVTIE